MKNLFLTHCLTFAILSATAQSFERDSNYHYSSRHTYSSKLHRDYVYTYGGLWGVDRTIKLQRFDLNTSNPVNFSNGTNILPLAANSRGHNTFAQVTFLEDTILTISFNDRGIYISRTLSDGTPLMSMEQDMIRYDSLANSRLKNLSYFWDNNKLSGFYSVLDSTFQEKLIFFKEEETAITYKEDLGFISFVLTQDSLTLSAANITLIEDSYFGISLPKFSGGSQRPSVFKLNRNFELDLSFGSNGLAELPIYSSSKPKFIADQSGNLKLETSTNTVHYKANGQIDSSKGVNGIATKPYQNSFKLGPNIFISFQKFYHTEDKIYEWMAVLKDSSENIVSSFGEVDIGLKIRTILERMATYKMYGC